MKKLMVISMLFLLTFNTALITFAGGTDVSSMQHTDSVSSSEGITPRKDITGWKYKNVDGLCYKRLYNYTKGEWVGGWIRC
ncbi:hypothetical protein [Ruminococcus gauvreauii]|uniref:hypothetical protein n=1 Tax=Ruminococcus gauvreauii TaxID=438033 RepID=UPI003983F08F